MGQVRHDSATIKSAVRAAIQRSQASIAELTLSRLMPHEHICQIWTSEPDRFIPKPIHRMPGLNT